MPINPRTLTNLYFTRILLKKIFSNSEKSNPVFSGSFDILICSKTFIILLFLLPSLFIWLKSFSESTECIKCINGAKPSDDASKCICDIGSKQNGPDACSKCSVNMYQDIQEQSSCKSCLTGYEALDKNDNAVNLEAVKCTIY